MSSTRYGALGEPSKHAPWRLRDNALLAAVCDPAMCTAAGQGSHGFLYLQKLWVPESVTIANLQLSVGTAGVGVTASQNWVGIYGSDGALIAKAGADADFAATGLRTIALAAEAGKSLTFGGPDVWVYGAILHNGSGATPAFHRMFVNAAILNANLTAPDGYRAAISSAGGLTALPAALPAIAAGNHLPFVGLK